MYGLSFPVVSIKLKATLLFVRRKSVDLGINRSWEGHPKKSGSLLVNHQFRDLIKIFFVYLRIWRVMHIYKELQPHSIENIRFFWSRFKAFHLSDS